MDLITAKYETRRIFNEETDYCYVENYEGNLFRIKKKRNDFLHRIEEEIKVKDSDWNYYKSYLADYLDKYLEYYSKNAIEYFEDSEYYSPEHEFYEEWKRFTHENGERFTHDEIMKDLVLSDLNYQFDYKDRVLNFQFILTHLNFYRLEKIITAIKLAYSVFKFRPEITNRIIKRNNEIYSYLRNFKYLNSYDAYIERLIEFINSSELNDKELMIKELSYCSKLPKERKIINVLEELKEFNKDEINQEDLDYLKKHPKALVLFTVEFEKDNPDDLKYIKNLIRSELTNKNPKKKLSEKVINQKIEQILKDLFNYDSIYVLVKRR